MVSINAPALTSCSALKKYKVRSVTLMDVMHMLRHLSIRKLNQPKKEAVSAEVSREPRAEMVPAGESASPDWS